MINKVIVLLVFFGLSSMSVLAFCIPSANSDIGGIDWIEVEYNKKNRDYVDTVENQKQTFSEVNEYVEDSDLAKKSESSSSNSASNKPTKKETNPDKKSSENEDDYSKLRDKVTKNDDPVTGTNTAASSQSKDPAPTSHNIVDKENTVTYSDDQSEDKNEGIKEDENPLEEETLPMGEPDEKITNPQPKEEVVEDDDSKIEIQGSSTVIDNPKGPTCPPPDDPPTGGPHELKSEEIEIDPDDDEDDEDEKPGNDEELKKEVNGDDGLNKENKKSKDIKKNSGNSHPTKSSSEKKKNPSKQNNNSLGMEENKISSTPTASNKLG
jgi:hypothetical protein